MGPKTEANRTLSLAGLKVKHSSTPRLLLIGFRGCGAQDGQAITRVGAKRHKFRFVLDVVQILPSFDRSQKRITMKSVFPSELTS
jgi:hypothetical protein